MRLKAICDMLLEAPQACPAIAMLRPVSGQAQWLTAERYVFEAHGDKNITIQPTEYVDSFGNLCQRFVVPAGRLRIRVESVVETNDDIAVDTDAPPQPIEELPDSVLQFLLASRYCPSDKAAERARGIVDGIAPGYAQVEAIRAWIHDNLTYRYGVSDEHTDAFDTLAAGAGVCRDFAHIGITFCRSLDIPARMVVGYLYRLDPMDLHAWFEAYVGGRWYTFDATQAEPRGGRIVVAYGRDAVDVAFLSSYGDAQLTTVGMEVSVELEEAAPPLPPPPRFAA